LLTLILLAVLTVVALAISKRTTTQVDAVGAKRNYDVAISCAEGARQMLFSQFRTFGVTPSQLTLDQNVDTKRLSSGHYDQFAVQSVVPATGAQANAVGLNDIANKTARARLGGAVYRMTVVCSDTTGGSRQSEVEFLVRFGL
jgi:hypothetical protein